MKKGLISKIFVILLVVGLLFAVAPTEQAKAAELCVNETGTGGCYSSIQMATWAANDGDTINVGPGTYAAQISISKGLTLKSTDGPGTTFIENPYGSISGAAINIQGLNLGTVTIDGFTLIGWKDIGILQQTYNNSGTSVHALNNVIILPAATAKTGIEVAGDGSKLINNTIIIEPTDTPSSASGIVLNSASDVLVEGNTIDGTVGVGIAIVDWGLPPDKVQNIQILNNDLGHAAEGIRINDVNLLGENVFKNNDFSKTDLYIAIRTAGYYGTYVNGTIDVSPNWFGSSLGPNPALFVDEQGADSFSFEPSIYTPWCANAECTKFAFASPTTLGMSPAEASFAGCGGETTVYVSVGEVEDLSSYSVVVNFDPAKVQVLEVEDAGLFGTGAPGLVIKNIDNEHGQLSYDFAPQGTGGVWNMYSGPGGNLVAITLKTLVAEPVVLELDEASELGHTDNAWTYPYTVSQATSTVSIAQGIVKNLTTHTDVIYCDLATAVAQAEAGDTLQAMQSFDVLTAVEINKELTFNVDTFTVTRTGATSAYDSLFHVVTGGDLTISGTGTLNATSTGGAFGSALKVTGGEASLQGPTLKGDYVSVRLEGNIAPGDEVTSAIFNVESGTVYDSIVVVGGGAVLNVTGGLVTSQPGGFAPITGNGRQDTLDYSGTVINISGSKDSPRISAPWLGTDAMAAIYHPQDGDLNISGGYITGGTGIIMKSGNLDLSGPTRILGYGPYAEPLVSGDGQNSTGDGILIYGGTGYTGDITVKIDMDPSGLFLKGFVSSNYGYAIREFSDTTTATRTSSVKIIEGGFLAWRTNTTSNTNRILLFTEQLRNAALAAEPNETLLITGGAYAFSNGEQSDPVYYVFPPYETYEIMQGSFPSYKIREMAGKLEAADLGFAKYDTGSLGYFAGLSSGWFLDEVPFADVAEAVVVMKDAAGNVLQTVTSTKLDTLPEPAEGVRRAFTAPFDIFGGFDYVTDAYWSQVKSSEYGQTVAPACVEATVTLKAGKVLTATNCVINAAPTYDDIKPIPVISSPDIQGYYLVGEERMFSVSVVNPLYGVDYTYPENPVYFEFQIDGVNLVDLVDGLYFWQPNSNTDFTPPADGQGTWVKMGSRPQETIGDCAGNICGTFGWVTTGMPLATNSSVNAYLKFAMANADAATMPFTINLVKKSDPTVPVSTFEGIAYVYDKATVTISDMDPYFLVDEPGAFKVTVNNPTTGRFYNNTAVFDIEITPPTGGGISALVCTSVAPMPVHTWTFDAGDFTTDPVTGVITARLGGEDDYFTVPALGADMVVSCEATFTKEGTYTASGNMVDVVSATVERIVSSPVTGSATVYRAPEMSAVFPTGPYPAGVPVIVEVTITNPDGLADPFELIITLADGTKVTVEVDPTAYPVTLEIPITFDTDQGGTVSLELYDDNQMEDRLLDSLTGPDVEISSGFSVSGTITLQGLMSRSGIPVTLLWDSSFASYGPSMTTDNQDVNFRLTVTYGGDYVLTTLQARFLNITEDLGKKFNVIGPTSIESLRLRAGNAYWRVFDDDAGVYTDDYDNEINGADASLVGGMYGKPGSADLTINHGDVNFDGIVNIKDLTLVGGNMGLTSGGTEDTDGAYTTWEP